MTKIKRVSFIGLLITILLVVTACGTNSAGKTGDQATGAQGAAAKDSIKIGWFGPLSGSGASMGVDAKAGVEAYIKKINDDGGINGRKVELVSYDDEYSRRNR